MITVLVADAQPHIVHTLCTTLSERGYDVLIAQDDQTAEDLAAEGNLDAVVLDPGLSGAKGTEMIARLRTRTAVPVIALSANAEPSRMVEVLDAGADDYVAKPFDVEVLLARLRAVLRRATPQDLKDPIVTTADFTIDLGAKKVHRGGDEVHLTPVEWAIVEILVRNSGRLVSQKELLRDVWGPSRTEETQYLRVYMGQLRHKLETQPSRPRHFITVPGLGCRFEL